MYLCPNIIQIDPMSKKYKIGYALCGGGAKGFAHLGALKVFEEQGIRPDVIAGTSAGALAGVLYADGFAPEEIADLFRGHKLTDFAGISLFSGGLFRPNGVAKMLRDNLHAHKFEELNIPFRAIATNWETAQVKVFSQGDNLVEAVIASCSVPMVFEPVEIDGVQYVDGGVLKNFPVSAIREETDCVIGVNLMKLQAFSRSKSIKGTASRYYDIISKLNVKDDVQLTDILIDMEGLHNYSMFDLKSIDAIINEGYKTTTNVLNSEATKHKLHASLI